MIQELRPTVGFDTKADGKKKDMGQRIKHTSMFVIQEFLLLGFEK